MNRNIEICLVTMPYGAIERPSIALGLLSEYAKQEGLNTKKLHFNLKFAKLIGLNLYQWLSDDVDVADQIGEWTFSKSAFGDFPSDSEAFLDLALEKYTHSELEAYFLNETIKDLLLNVYNTSDAFIEDCCEEIISLHPRFVGVTSTFQQNCASIALIKKLKSKNPNIITALGGANCEGVMGLTLSNEIPEIDFIFSGEADESFPKFCRLLKSNDFDVSKVDWRAVDGLIPTKKLRKRIFTNDSVPRSKVQDLNQLPIPNYDDYFQQLDEYALADYVEPGLLVETARGCWWGKKKHCIFCGLNGENMDFRSKTPERFVREIDALVEKYGGTRVEMVDNILDMKYFKSVFYQEKLLDKPYNIFCETKSNLNEKQIIALSKNRIRWIQPGIESLHKELIKIIQKGNTTISSIELLKYGLENGVRISWNFLFGFLGEKDEWYYEMASWIPLITHLQPPSCLLRVRFDRFSPYHSLSKFYGLNLDPNISYSYIYPFEKEVLANMAYFFEDYTLIQRGSMQQEGIKNLAEAIDNWASNFGKNADSKLIVTEGVEKSIIIDTRPIVGNGKVILTGIQHLLHRICRKPSTFNAIKAKLRVATPEMITDAVIQEHLEKLVAMNLIFHNEHKYITLAIYPPREQLLDSQEYPGGRVNLSKIRAENRKTLLVTA